MTKRRATSPSASTDRFFVKELSGETPPSFATMQRLYRLASELYGHRPWDLLDEEELVLVKNAAMGETIYGSVMGAIGEVFAIQAYIGDESYRLFRAVEADEISDHLEFFGGLHSISVEFVPMSELEPQDQRLLVALGHPLHGKKAAPIFRAIRPGYQPWFVTEEEASALVECLSALLLICSIVSGNEEIDYWGREDWYPLVERVGGEEPTFQYAVGLVHAPVPAMPSLDPASLSDAQLQQIRGRDYPVGGVIELDSFFSGGAIGERHERKFWTRTAMAVDAKTGIVFPPEVFPPDVPVGNALLGALTKAIQTTRSLPREIKVQSRRYKDCLTPVAQILGCQIKTASRLPALAEARDSLRQMMRMGGPMN